MCSHNERQTTGGPGPLDTAAETAKHCHKTLPLLAGLCEHSNHCCVAAAKRNVRNSNLGRNSRNSGRLLTSFFQNFDVLGTFCGRKYAHLDVYVCVCVCVPTGPHTGAICENPHSKPGQVANWCRQQSAIMRHSDVGPMTSLYIAYELILRQAPVWLYTHYLLYVCVITCKISILMPFMRTHTQWSNCGGTRGNGVPLPFLAGERRSPSLHDDSYLQHKQHHEKNVR